MSDIKRVDVIKAMIGKGYADLPLFFEDEAIYAWDLNLEFEQFSDKQIEEFYDAEIGDEES